MFSVLHISGPEELGGYGDMAGKLAAAVKATGKTIVEVADSVFLTAAGDITRVPGIPELYDYEYFPQEVSCLLNNG
jgi:hypothetical protein